MGKVGGVARTPTSCVRSCPACKSSDVERQGASRAPVGSWEDPVILFWLMRCRACGQLFEYRELADR